MIGCVLGAQVGTKVTGAFDGDTLERTLVGDRLLEGCEEPPEGLPVGAFVGVKSAPTT